MIVGFLLIFLIYFCKPSLLYQTATASVSGHILYNEQHRIALEQIEIPTSTSFILCLLFGKIMAQPTNCAHLAVHQEGKNISEGSAGQCCKRLMSTNCQIKRSERMISPLFSRISSKLPRSMFGSKLWHPGEYINSHFTQISLICIIRSGGAVKENNCNEYSKYSQTFGNFLEVET